MGYNLSKHAFIRHRPQIERIKDEEATIHFPTENPRRLAYKLREAFHAAKAHEEFEHYYDELWHRVKIHEAVGSVRVEWLEEGEVSAEPFMEESGGDEVETPSRVSKPSSSPSRPPRKVLKDAHTLVDVLGAALKFSAETELSFPNTKFSEEELQKLYAWTQKKGEWTLISHDFGDGEGGITLTKNPVAEEIQWRP